MLVDAHLALYLQPGGHALLTFPSQPPDPETQLAAALVALAELPPGGRRHFVLATVDGVAVRDTLLYASLMKLGYAPEYGCAQPYSIAEARTS